MAGAAAPTRERSLALWLVGATAGVILLFGVFGPPEENTDPTPSTYNSAPAGIKAAYLLLGETGYGAERRDAPLGWLATADAAHTTAIFVEPVLPLRDLPALQGAVAGFLARGGRVLATGATGALLLGGKTEGASHLYTGLCRTVPEGGGAEAEAGTVSLAVPVRWGAGGPQYRVEQRCGTDAVVVVIREGQGQAVWWSSAMPMTNGALEEEANLRLLLGAVGSAGRTVVFDEYLRERHETIFDLVGGLPWAALGWQAFGVATLLVLSFGRRSGPVRARVAETRGSPVEFAESMGRLYRSAGASGAAIGAAEGRLRRCLREQCGVSRETLQDPAAVAETLGDRLGGEWTRLRGHLEQARQAEGTSTLSPKSTLRLVQALEADERELREAVLHRNFAGRIG